MINKHLGSIPEKFFHSAIQNREKTAFIYRTHQGWKSLTYGEFLTKVSAVAHLLKAKNISSKDRVAICSENNPEWCAIYIAATSIGAVCIPIDSELDPSGIFNILNHSNTILIFTSDNTNSKVITPAKNAGIDVINFGSDEFISTWQSASPTMVKEMSTVSPNDSASIIYTSGTTNTPKGVMLTHYNLCSSADSLIQTNLFENEDNVLALLPLHHIYPFMCSFIVPILLGATVTYPSLLKPEELIEIVKNKDVTIILAVPKLIKMILNGIETRISKTKSIQKLTIKILRAASSNLRGYFELNIGNSVFSNIHKMFGRQFRFFVSGGDKLLPEIMKRLEAYGFTILETYGLTETSSSVTFSPYDHRKPGSSGIALRDVVLKIDAKKDEEGEILIKGPMVMNGYYQMDEEGEALLKDGWFHTGDIGYIDNEGYLFITGRKKELISLSSDQNIYPEDIERHYSAISLIKEICVYENNQKGGTISAIIVPDLEEARKQKIANIYEYLKWEINKISLKLHKFIRLNEFSIRVEPFPKTALGKLQRFLIKENFEGTKTKKFIQKKDTQSQLNDEFYLQVINTIKTIIGTGVKDDISLSDNLEFDLGLDSLNKIELIVELERALRFSLPKTFILDVQTVFDLTEKLRYHSSLPRTDAIIDSSGDRFSEILSLNPSFEELKSIGLSRTRHERRIVNFMLFWIRFFFKVFFFATIKGIKNLPASPFILCPNYSSILDPFLISSLLPKRQFRDIFFQGIQRFFDTPFKKKFAAIAHVIPIDRETFLTKGLSQSSYILKNRKSLCIFPEGGRTFDGTIAEFKKGIAILAVHCNVPLVPIYIKGTYKALPRNKSIPRIATKITIKIGEPIYPQDFGQEPDKDNHKALADKVREGVLALAGKM